MLCFIQVIDMDIKDKLRILADSAKYDVSCSSSGSKRKNENGIGNGHVAGICHSFAADGRCISLLKILMTNSCIYDCKYCANRSSNNVERAIFTPMEIAELTINFYRRNYIEGLFLSSGIIRSPDYTMQKLYETVELLRNKYRFFGYIHVKAIPGANQDLIKMVGKLADRMSINIELPSNDSLRLLAPNKEKDNIVKPMKYISTKIKEDKKFVQAGQTTQLIIGATPDSDYKIMSLAESMYQRMSLKRVYYSAYIPINQDSLLPAIDKPPLLRENRLYQADWLLRFYGFKTDEILNELNPNFNTLIDPKADWAIRNLSKFPVEINTVPYDMLIRVPGLGIKSAQKIASARKFSTLTFVDLKRMHISIKRAKYFITCDGKYFTSTNIFDSNIITRSLIYEDRELINVDNIARVQLSLFEPTREDKVSCLSGQL